MTSALTVEDSGETHTSQKVWGLHNGIVVLAAVGLGILSSLVQLLQYTEPLAGAPDFVLSLMGQLSGALLISAGAVIGMLVATRILQAHVSARGAKVLALWGVGVIALGLILQAALFAIDWQASELAPGLLFLSRFLGQLLSFVGVFVNVGAAMLALAFVARLRR